MLTLSLFLSTLAYGAFYAAAPGRQSHPVGPVRPLLGVGAAMTIAALVLSGVATRSAVGPTLVLTTMMAVASTLAVVGPFVFPTDSRPGRPRASRKSSADEPFSTRPAARPAELPPTSGS